MVRTGVIFGIAAVLALIGGLLIPLGGFQLIIAFASLIALGWGAGYTAAKTTTDPAGGGIGRGAVAGVIAGAVVLVVITLLFLVLANTQAFDDAVQAAWQQSETLIDPNTADPASVDPVTVTVIAGAGGGFCIGLISMVVMFIAGAVGGLMGKGVPSIANTGEGAYGSTDVTASGRNTQAADRRTTDPS